VNTGPVFQGAIRAARSRLGALFSASVGLALFVPSLLTGARRIDDHEVWRVLSYKRMPAGMGIDSTTYVRQSLSAFGRFRPLYGLIRMVEIQGTRGNWAAYHGLCLCLAAFTGYMTFQLAKDLRIRSFMAGPLAIATLAFPMASETWTRLGLAETWAVPLTLVACRLFLEYGRKGRRTVGLLALCSMLSAVLLKENFLFVAPPAVSLVLFSSLTDGASLCVSLRKYRAILSLFAFAAAAVGVAIFRAATSAGPESYGGQSVARGLPLLVGVEMARQLFVAAPYFSLFGACISAVGPVSIVMFTRATNSSLKRSQGLAGLCFLAGFGVQFLAHMSRGGWASGRYLNPAVLLLGMSMTLMVEAISPPLNLRGGFPNRYPPMAVLLVVALAATAIAGVRDSRDRMDSAVAESASANRLFAALAAGRNVGLLVEKDSDFESAFSAFTRLSAMRQPGATAPILVIQDDAAGTAFDVVPWSSEIRRQRLGDFLETSGSGSTLAAISKRGFFESNLTIKNWRKVDFETASSRVRWVTGTPRGLPSHLSIFERT
jgi:hypothetical protein